MVNSVSVVGASDPLLTLRSQKDTSSMKKYETKDLRDVALLGHGKSGKTSLAEAISRTAEKSSVIAALDRVLAASALHALGQRSNAGSVVLPRESAIGMPCPLDVVVPDAVHFEGAVVHRRTSERGGKVLALVIIDRAAAVLELLRKRLIHSARKCVTRVEVLRARIF